MVKFALLLLTVAAVSFSAEGFKLSKISERIKNAKSITEHPLMAEKLEKFAKNSGGTLEADRKIMNGSQAVLGEFPYHAALFSIDAVFEIYWCGATLIRYNWVLTTAYCANNFMMHFVVLGTINVFIEDPTWESDMILPNHVYVHPQFNAELFRNNIALIHMDSADVSILSHPHIAVLSLPTRADAGFNLVGRNGTVTGTGLTEYDGVGLLYSLTMPIIDNAVCTVAFPDYTTDASICASTVSGNVCAGDTGGPMVVEMVGGRNIVAGIVTFNLRDCTLEYPAMFERVSSHLDWIDVILANGTYTTTTTTAAPITTTTAAPGTTTPSSSSAISFSMALLAGALVVAFGAFN